MTKSERGKVFTAQGDFIKKFHNQKAAIRMGKRDKGVRNKN